MKFIYIIGSYDADTEEKIEQNVHAVSRVAGEIIHLTDDFIPLLPHAQGWWIDKHSHHDHDYWLLHTMELLKRCDCAMVVGDISNSDGSQREVAYCRKVEMPVIFLSRCLDLKEALLWLRLDLADCEPTTLTPSADQSPQEGTDQLHCHRRD